MATATNILVLLFTLGTAHMGLARRVKKDAAQATVNVESTESTETNVESTESTETQQWLASQEQKWNYDTASTAWDVLCHARASGVFGANWEHKKWHKFQNLEFKCDPDERANEIKVTWKGWTGKEMFIKKDATPVTQDGFHFRFFLESEGCDSIGSCDLPWAPFDVPRNNTQKPKVVNRYLVYDARETGARVVTIETNHYSAWFYKSDIKELGTGVPVPSQPTYAGDVGTGCGLGVNGCSEPISSPQPEDSVKTLDVTTKYILDCPSSPGYICLMTNRNWAKISKTDVDRFDWSA